jgi:hypothetical protein
MEESRGALFDRSHVEEKLTPVDRWPEVMPVRGGDLGSVDPETARTRMP